MLAMEGTSGVLVAHAMTGEVVVTHPESTLWEAARTLREADISGAPVVDLRGVLVGILSEKDIARSLAELTGRHNAPHVLDVLLAGGGTVGSLAGMAFELLQNTRVSEAMSRDPITTSPDTPLDKAAGIMKERRINRLPVLQSGHLVGILTRHDILAATP